MEDNVELTRHTADPVEKATSNLSGTGTVVNFTRADITGRTVGRPSSNVVTPYQIPCVESRVYSVYYGLTHRAECCGISRRHVPANRRSTLPVKWSSFSRLPIHLTGCL